MAEAKKAGWIRAVATDIDIIIRNMGNSRSRTEPQRTYFRREAIRIADVDRQRQLKIFLRHVLQCLKLDWDPSAKARLFETAMVTWKVWKYLPPEVTQLEIDSVAIFDRPRNWRYDLSEEVEEQSWSLEDLAEYVGLDDSAESVR